MQVTTLSEKEIPELRSKLENVIAEISKTNAKLSQVTFLFFLY